MTRCGVLAALAFCLIAISNSCSNVAGPDPEEVVSISYSVSGFGSTYQFVVTDSTLRLTDQIMDFDTSFADTLFLAELVKSVNLTHAVNEGNDLDVPSGSDGDVINQVAISYTSKDDPAKQVTKEIRYSNDAPDSVRDLARLLVDKQWEIRRRIVAK